MRHVNLKKKWLLNVFFTFCSNKIRCSINLICWDRGICWVLNEQGIFKKWCPILIATEETWYRIFIWEHLIEYIFFLQHGLQLRNQWHDDVILFLEVLWLPRAMPPKISGKRREPYFCWMYHFKIFWELSLFILRLKTFKWVRGKLWTILLLHLLNNFDVWTLSFLKWRVNCCQYRIDVCVHQILRSFHHSL